MTYQLGVDLGTTYTAAAINRDGRVEMTTLGTTSPVMPSVVLLRADGEVLVGEVAVRRGLAEPTRVAREFKRRLGDPTPLVLGGTPYGAEALMGHLLRAVVATVTEREGEAPSRMVLTHPANFGPYKLDMMREVARLGGLNLDTTTFLTEPEAAAISYATRNRVDPGEIVAVYDFGGGTFDAAMVQRGASGFSLMGRPEGMERFGGIDIDAAIVAHVDHMLDGAISRMNGDDPDVQAAVARLKDDCRAAKEALSGDTDTSISVSLPGLQTQVRLTRGELEEMVRPRIRETIEALDRAVRSAGITMEQVSRVLLVGGSSRMPLVAEMIRNQTGRPVAVDAHPKFAIAMGAAALGQQNPVAVTPPVLPPTLPTPPAPAAPSAPTLATPATPATPPVRTPPPAATTPTAPTATTPSRPAASATPAHTPATTPATPSSGKPGRTKLFVILGAVAALIIGVVAVVALTGGDEGTTENTRPPRTRPDDTDPPETDPPDTVVDTVPPTDPSVPVPDGILSIDQLRSITLTAADLEAGFAPAGEVPDDGSTEGLCNSTITVFPVNSLAVQFTRGLGTIDGQALTHALESYDSADAAAAAFGELVTAARACTEFSVIDPSNGSEIRVLVQGFDENPIGGCNSAFSLRLDSFDFASGTPLNTRVALVEVCGQNAVSIAVDMDPNSAAAVQDGTSPVFNTIGGAIFIAVQRLNGIAG